MLSIFFNSLIRLAQVLQAAVDRVFSPHNIKSGFRKAGIFPLNKDAIDKTLLAPKDPEFNTINIGPGGDNSSTQNPSTPDPLCHSCGQFVMGHPLVNQGLIPKDLADVLVPIIGTSLLFLQTNSDSTPGQDNSKLPKAHSEHAEVDLSVITGSTWHCHLCNIFAIAQDVETEDPATDVICQVCMASCTLNELEDGIDLFWIDCRCGKSFHKSCLPVTVYRQWDLAKDKWCCGQCLRSYSKMLI